MKSILKHVLIGIWIGSFISILVPVHATGADDILDIANTVKSQERQARTFRSGSQGDPDTSPEELEYDAATVIGDHLALEGFRRYGLPVKNDALQKYVNIVGNALARNADKSDMPFYFVVVDSPLHASFACSGGVIFITSAFVRSMEDEAELASVLAHEIAHIDLNHVLRTATGSGLSKDTPFEDLMEALYIRLFEKGLDPAMELKADRAGMKIAWRTGYDPKGFIRVLRTLQSGTDKGASKGSWFATHPPLAKRIELSLRTLAGLPGSADMATVKDRFSTYRAGIQ